MTSWKVISSTMRRNSDNITETWYHLAVSSTFQSPYFRVWGVGLWKFSCPFLLIKTLDPTWECGFKAFQWRLAHKNGLNPPNHTIMSVCPTALSTDSGEFILHLLRATFWVNNYQQCHELTFIHVHVYIYNPLFLLSSSTQFSEVKIMGVLL